MARARGFTLLEVLIAISIFALIGLGAYRLLTTIVDTHQRVRSIVDDISEVSRAMTLIERDIYQATLRPIRDEYGEPLPAMMVGTGTWPMEFTRAGWNNPAGLPRSSLQRVAYGLGENGGLVRYFWLVLDRAEDSAPIEQRLVGEVTDFRISVLTVDDEVQDTWPASADGAPFPAAVEIVIATDRTGEIRRLIPLVTPAAPVGGAPSAGEGAS